MTLAILVRGVASDWTPIERAGLVAAFLAFPSLAISFFKGSFALVLVVGVAGAWLAMERQQGVRAGVLLALATVKPQGVFGVIIAMLLMRRPAAIVALVAWVAALAGVATVVLGPGIWSSYLSFLGSQTSSFDRYSVCWGIARSGDRRLDVSREPGDSVARRDPGGERHRRRRADGSPYPSADAPSDPPGSGLRALTASRRI